MISPSLQEGGHFDTRHIIICMNCQIWRTVINTVICDLDAVLVTGVYRDLVQKAFKATKYTLWLTFGTVVGFSYSVVCKLEIDDPEPCFLYFLTYK